MKEESKKSFLNYVLNISIIVFTIICLVLGYSLFKNSLASRQEKQKSITDTLRTNITNQPNKAYQIDVQNGTGENGIAADFRAYLKKKGFDVVEMGNYKNTDVNKTMVIDRNGNMNAAKKVAESLGVTEKNIIQQKDTTSFLDVTVIIGKDFQELNPYKEKVKK
jgi:hypothetical protein